MFQLKLVLEIVLIDENKELGDCPITTNLVMVRKVAKVAKAAKVAKGDQVMFQHPRPLFPCHLQYFLLPSSHLQYFLLPSSRLQLYHLAL